MVRGLWMLGKKMKIRPSLSAIAVLAVSAILSGCGGGEPEALVQANPPVLPPIEPVTADAGVPVSMVADPTFERTKTLAMAQTFGRRSDPFRLLGSEQVFEARQQVERARQEYGGWFGAEFDFGSASVAPGMSAQPDLVVEPQPFRRLSGILLGNGVAALIVWEDGRVYEIVPGSQIPGTDWVVISIDSERAILRRSGNRLPKEIIVRLGPSVSGYGAGDTGGGDNNNDGGKAPAGPGGRGRDGR